MHTAIPTFFKPIISVNPRVSIGGGVLSLLIAGETAMTVLRPLS